MVWKFHYLKQMVNLKKLQVSVEDNYSFYEWYWTKN